MRKYIKSELYRSFNRPYYRNTILIISFLCAMFWLMLATNLEFDFAFETGIEMLSLPIYLLLIFTTIITGEDIKDKTIKNSVGLGLSRDKIVIGKIITSIILAFIAAIIILLVYFLSASLALTDVGSLQMDLVREFFLKLLGLIPIWIGGIAIGTFVSILTSSEALGVMTYFLIISIIPSMIDLMAMLLDITSLSWIRSNLGITEVIRTIIQSPSLVSGIKTGLQVGGIYFLVFAGLSILLFRRKDL